jgi:hypothetical protein
MAKDWTLKVLYHTSGNVAEVPVVSADAGKREAKEYKTWAQTKEISFKIYDPQGSLYQYTEPGDSWRLRWLWSK